MYIKFLAKFLNLKIWCWDWQKRFGINWSDIIHARLNAGSYSGREARGIKFRTCHSYPSLLACTLCPHVRHDSGLDGPRPDPVNEISYAFMFLFPFTIWNSVDVSNRNIKLIQHLPHQSKTYLYPTRMLYKRNRFLMISLDKLTKMQAPPSPLCHDYTSLAVT